MILAGRRLACEFPTIPIHHMPDSAPDKPQTLYIIDGHGQFFRAYHAIRSGMTSPVTGEPINMVFGFVGILLKLLKDYQPDYLAVVIDVAGDRETFRSEIYPEYKATRKETPEDFHPQVERCLAILRSLRIPVLGEPGVEADDVIASLVRRLEREHPDLHIRLVTRDKDLTQLINDRVELLDIYKDQAVTPEDLFKTPGLKPQHVRDVLALMGDTIDNIPGVPGIGEKTAGALLLQYGSIDNLLSHLDEIKGKRRESLESSRETLALSRQLVALKDDLPLDFELEQAICDPAMLPVDDVMPLFRELGFNRHRDELLAMAQQASNERKTRGAMSGASAAPRDSGEAVFAESLFGVDDSASPHGSAAESQRGVYEAITTLGQLDAFIAEIRKVGFVSIDTETDRLGSRAANMCGICMSIAAGTGVYIPVRSPEPQRHLTQHEVIERLRPVLEDAAIAKCGHNLKFDINVLRKAGIRIRGIDFDTMVASYVIDATRSSHGLEVLAMALLNYHCIPITQLIGTGKSQRTFDCIAIDKATQYAAEDADVALRLREVLEPTLHAMKLDGLFRNVELPLVEVLAELEWNGIRVDPDELDRQREHLAERIMDLRRKINDAAPHPFNPDSPKQLVAVLFNKPADDPPGLGIRPLRRGKTGPSTDQEVLERIAANPDIASPVPALIVEYRQLTKLVNTYLVALKDAILPDTGRVHASFNQTVAATGRLSSSDPNLQNIPIRSDIGREIRRAFIAGPGNVLLSADYSQIELRLLAHLSGDPALIDAFQQDLDIHTAVAAQVFNVGLAEVTREQRNSAKMVNFGIVYGITPSGLARRLGPGVSIESASKIISDYRARFARIGEFLDRCVHTAETNGYVETILGRRRAIPQIHAGNPQQRALGERVAINTVVQGSAADLIKIAMIELYRNLPRTFANAKMLLQIHDELVFEAPQADAEAMRDFVIDSMQRAMQLRVPLKVDAAWSTRWIDAK
jgi:DNA polymerase-1